MRIGVASQKQKRSGQGRQMKSRHVPSKHIARPMGRVRAPAHGPGYMKIINTHTARASAVLSRRRMI